MQNLNAGILRALGFAVITCAIVISLSSCGPHEDPDDRASKLAATGLQASQNGDFALAQTSLEEAIKQARLSKNAFQLPAIMVEYADVAMAHNQFTLAETNLREALHLYDHAANMGLHKYDRDSIAGDKISVLSKLGDVLTKENRADDAMKAYKEAFTQAKQSVGTLSAISSTLRKYCALLRAKGMTEEAEKIELDFELQDPDNSAKGVGREGFAFMDIGKYAQAERQFLLFSMISKERRNFEDEVTALKYMAIAELCQGKREKAERNAREALRVAMSHPELPVKHVNESAIITYLSSSHLSQAEKARLLTQMEQSEGAYGASWLVAQICQDFSRCGMKDDMERAFDLALLVARHVPAHDKKDTWFRVKPLYSAAGLNKEAAQIHGAMGMK